MKGVELLKTALGMIIRSLDKEEEVLRFIDNAEKYGHKLDCVVVAYNHTLDPRVASAINDRIPLFAIDTGKPDYCSEQFRRRGMSYAAARALLQRPVDPRFGLVPYGFNRNMVIIEAILRGIELLFFVDNDVYPMTLKPAPGGHAAEDIDFFGGHLEHLRSGSQITTGEYSGYNILPPVSFPGMDYLLHGLQKSDMLEYWQDCANHRCLTMQSDDRATQLCTKILGGNTAFTLSAFFDLPPFFSTSYIHDGELYLARGEDTVLGLGIAVSGTVCTDVKLFPLHDTYKNYPEEPDLVGDPMTQERFYYACTGWVGRNPFYNYLRGNDVKSIREFQRDQLERGIPALVESTSNQRFANVLKAFDTSWDSLGRYISEYDVLLSAWKEFMRGAFA